MKSRIAMVVAIIMGAMTTSVFAVDQNLSNNDFVVENNILVKYNGKDKNVNIPENLGIKGIGKEAFFENKNIISVAIPKEVAEIGPGAFAGCRELESINIPREIKIIESYTFYNCTKLKRLEFPYGLVIIEDESIQNCHALEIVRIPDTVKSIGKTAFYGTSLAKIEGIKGSYAEEFARNAYNYHYTGNESLGPAKGIPFIPQTFASTNTVLRVDGKQVSFTVYNINGHNYFKLRDVAQVLNGTRKQFSVDWNGNGIDLVSNKAYKSTGNQKSNDKSTAKQIAYIPKMSVNIDGKSVDVYAYNLGGHSYFQFRGLIQILNFGVEWDGKSMGIDTTK